MASLRTKLGLLRGLLSGDGVPRTGPFFVTVDVTRRCNLRCIGCRYHSPDFHQPSPGDQEVLDISEAMVAGLLEELADLKTRGVRFIGEGEPFLHPAIVPMMAGAARAGFRVAVTSNGTMIDRRVASELVRAGVDEVVVSLWAATPETALRHGRDTSPIALARAVSGLEALAAARRDAGGSRPSIHVYQPLTRFNLPELGRLAALAERYGCDQVRLGPLREHEGGVRGLALTPDQERELPSRLAAVGRRLERAGVRHNVAEALEHYRVGQTPHRILPCYVGWFHARIKVDGTVLPCNACSWGMGSLQERSFAEIWSGASFRAFRRRATTRQGLASLSDDCDCGFCCHVSQNLDVHRRLRWLPRVGAGDRP